MAPPVDRPAPLKHAAWSLFFPVLLVVCFVGCRRWLLHQIIPALIASNPDPDSEAFFNQLDVLGACLAGPEANSDIYALLEDGQLCTRLKWQSWAIWLSVSVFGAVLSSLFVIRVSARKAQKSIVSFSRAFNLAWRWTLGTIRYRVLVEIPLVIFALIEFRALVFQRWDTALVIFAIGAAVMVTSFGLLSLHAPSSPLSFLAESISKNVGPNDAPELWDAAIRAANTLNTTPPDNILSGPDIQLYFTELDVVYELGVAKGRTLCVPQTYLQKPTPPGAGKNIYEELQRFIGPHSTSDRALLTPSVAFNHIFRKVKGAPYLALSARPMLRYFEDTFLLSEQRLSLTRKLENSGSDGTDTSSRT